MSRKKSLQLDRIGARTAVGFGILGLAYELLLASFHGIEVLRPHIEFVEHFREPLLTILLSFLVGGLGYQRLVAVEEVLDRQEEALALLKDPKVRLLMGQDLEQAAHHLVSTCHDTVCEIHATEQFALPNEGSKAGLPEGYFNMLAQRVAEAHAVKRKLVYRVVLPKDDLEALRVRFKAFAAKEVLSHLEVKFAETSWPLDVLVVGKSAQLAFHGSAPDDKYELGIEIREDEAAARIIETWFREHLWDRLGDKLSQSEMKDLLNAERETPTSASE